MLCRRCEDLALEGGGRLRSTFPKSRASAGPLGSIICGRCGAVLSAEDHVEPLLDKLAQLAQFGLAGESRPLLEPSSRKED